MATGRSFPASASARNLARLFDDAHKNYQINGFLNVHDLAMLRYLGYLTIGLGISVITVTIVFLPFIFSSLDSTKASIQSNGDIFKAKSNTLWSQMQSLKRNIYRRSIASNPETMAFFDLLPKNYIPFPFQKFRIKSHPPSISPENFKEILEKEIEKIFNEDDFALKKFNDPSAVNEGQIISSEEIDTADELIQKLLKEKLKNVMEAGAMESLRNAFKLAEQEEMERQGEKMPKNSTALLSSDGYGNEEIVVKSSENESSAKNESENSLTIVPYKDVDEMVENSSTIPPSKNAKIVENSSTPPPSKNTQSVQHPSTPPPSKNAEMAEKPSEDEIAISQDIAYMEELLSAMETKMPNCGCDSKENLIIINSPEDEEKCHGDPGEAGNDGYDGYPGSDGI